MSTRVVFDFGAVLFRWRPAVVVSQHLPQHARGLNALQATVAELFQGYGGDWGQFDLGLADAQQTAERIAARTGWQAAQVRALIDAVPDELQPQPAVLALLLQLREQRVPLSFLSNMPPPYADQIEARWPLMSWFDSGVFSGRVHLSKPDAEIFLLAAQTYGSAPADCLLIDDHPANIEDAKACGWQAELFTDALGLARALRARGLLR